MSLILFPGSFVDYFTDFFLILKLSSSIGMKFDKLYLYGKLAFRKYVFLLHCIFYFSWTSW